MTLMQRRSTFDSIMTCGPIAVLLLLTLASAASAQNLIANPGFDGNPPSGWYQIWSRDTGAASESTSSEPTPSHQLALKVVSTGEKDWSVGQTDPIHVRAGDILDFSGWIKAEGSGNVQLSLHTSDADGKTVDWMAGLVDAGGTHPWNAYRRRLVVPPGVATVQYRLTGDGPETCWLSAPALTYGGSTKNLVAQWHGGVFNLASSTLKVRFNPALATLAIVDKRNGLVWWQSPVNRGVLVKSAKVVSSTELRFTLWDVANDLNLAADVKLDAKLPKVSMVVDGTGGLSSPLNFPQPFQTGTGDCLVVPLNEGILYPVDDATIDPYRLPTYMGNSTSMPWLGIMSKSGAGLLTLVNTPDDAAFDIARPTSTLTASPSWEGSKGQFAYARKLTYVVFDKGGYVAQAKWYRRYAQTTGLFRTLAEKRKANSNVDKLIGAANVWNWDVDKVDLCREIKAAGMQHVLWSNGGNREEIEAINKLGFLTSRYDIYQDVWPSTAPDYLHKQGWPDDLVLLPTGDWMKGWADIATNKDGTKTTYQGGVINSARGLARAKHEIPVDLKNTPYECRFLDTTTASPWREDYNPNHPLTRSQDRANKMALLAFCSRDMKLVTGSETGIDTAVPYVDYFEGMMSLSRYRLEDAGRNMPPPEAPTPEILKFMVGPKYRIPLWELVYHDCVVAYWYWGDYNNKIPDVWRQRDLLNILYGTPPMYMFDRSTWSRDRDKFILSYRQIAPVARRLGYDEMLSHSFLSNDHALQETRWKSGATVIVNLSGDDRQLTSGQVIKPWGYWVSPARGSTD